MDQEDFESFLAKNEDKFLSNILLSMGLIDKRRLKLCLQEKKRKRNVKLGQMLVQKRLLSLQNYQKVLGNVNNHAKMAYEKFFTKESQKDNQIVGISQNFGKYEIIKEIARGGMGVIHEARNIKLDRMVALKILLAGRAAREEEIKRFYREAKIASKLSHPNIVSIYEIGEYDNYPYFTMEYIKGSTLQDAITKKLKLRKLLSILIDSLRALEYAQSQGIIHRDIKPSNILISPEGKAKLTDFGLAKDLEIDNTITRNDSTVGTPFYMAPEQILGNQDIDGRADIYSMGVILYEILTGRVPFKGSSIIELYNRVLEENPIFPSRLSKKVDKKIEAICLKAIEKKAYLRYQTAAEFADDIENYLQGKPINAKRQNLFSRMGQKLKYYQAITLGISSITIFIILLSVFVLSKKQQEKDSKLTKVKILLQSGKSEIEKENFSTGVEKYKQAIDIYPNYKQSYLLLGDAYFQKHRYQQALNEYKKTLKIDKTDHIIYYKIGITYAKLEKTDEANRFYSLAIENRPEFIKAYFQKAKILENKKKNEEAIIELQKIEFIKKDFLTRADIFINKKQYDQAIALYNEILEIEPENTMANYGQAKIYMAQKKYIKAINKLTQIIKHDPSFTKAHSALSTAYKKMGKKD